MSNTLKNSWWPEKYRPTTLDGYVSNTDLLDKMKYWIETQDPPNLIFYSEYSGTGKSTACKILAKSIDADILTVNASNTNGIDTVRDTINSFAQTASFKKFKIVILEEFSRFSKVGQSALLDTIEKTSSTTRFFMTGNYIDMFLPAIISRCLPIKVESPPAKKIYENLESILSAENVTFERTDLANVIKKFYPDQRAMINYLQVNSHTGKLNYSDELAVTNEYCNKILEELKSNVKNPKQCFKNIRQIIADSKVRTFDDLFRFLFDNLDDYVPDGKKANIIQCLAEFQFKMSSVVDKEIQCAAMFVQMLNELQ